MAKYNKGANAERQLMQIFAKSGFSVARIAGSGSNPLPCPDLIAMKKGAKLALEVKSVKSDYLNISHEQMEEQLDWAKNAEIELKVAWKIHKKGFYLIDSKFFKKNKVNYAIKVDVAMRNGIAVKEFLVKK